MTDSFAATHIRAFNERATPLPGARVQWLADARAANLTAFESAGFPTARDEQWRYTGLKTLANRGFAVDDPEAATRAVEASEFALPGVAGARLVFVNGVHRADLSALDALGEGCSVASLADALEHDADGLRFFLSRHFRERAEGFACLNAAFAGHGAVVRIAAGVRIEAPLHLVHVGAAAATDVAWHARNIVELGDGAQLTVVEHYLGVGAHANFGNVVNQISVQRGARLDWIRLNDEDEGATLIARSEVRLAEDAVLATWSLDVGAALARHDLDVDLAGRGARVSSRGVFALHGRQHADNQLAISHSAKDTKSEVQWRGAVDQRARGVFHGRIVVQAGADGADAQLQNKNLLLSPHAEIDTKPVLEIFADEVKAAHGATVGQLDEGALFYLRARGIPAALARTMLTFAFCRAMLDDVPVVALRDHVAQLLVAHLPRHGLDLESVS